jgi:hypothetical protein
MRFFTLVLLLGSVLTSTFAQSDFSVAVHPFTIDGFDGVQSFVSATHDGHILIIGGRKDGLHRRQPFASFLASDNNTTIHLLHPETGGHWSESVSVLPEPLQEQLQSTNMQFHQVGDQLIITGGYGFSPGMNDHITYAMLTVVDVPGLVSALLNDGDIAHAFQYVPDFRMAVTGGYLQHLQDTFYLVGGHRFTGRYNPHNGPSFEQEYTNAIRRFTIDNIDSDPSIGFYEAWTDEMNLHRRDYNLVKQVFPGGALGMTAFSGVFQHAVDLPFLNSVDITSSGYNVNNDFEQHLNHYHCGTAPIYDTTTGDMHTLFFGGMSQFYLDAEGELREDQEVPFVPTIGRVTRQADGSMAEQRVGELPALLGAGSEFIPVGNTLDWQPDIQMLNLPAAGDSLFIGYLVGGIESTQPNIFFINDGTQSVATNSLFRVYLKPEGISNNQEVPAQPKLQSLLLSPNPAADQLQLSFELAEAATVLATLVDYQGKIIRQTDLGYLGAGEQTATLGIEDLPTGAYLLNLSAGQSQVVERFLKK